LERRGNRPFEALGQWTHIRKSGTETVRPRCICQHLINSVELELNQDKLLLTMQERSGSIWMLDNVDR
jgi:hypothetical protein